MKHLLLLINITIAIPCTSLGANEETPTPSIIPQHPSDFPYHPECDNN